jgi:hypothetical protein
VLAELGMVLADSRYSLADRAGHTGSSALGGGCGSPIATTQADRTRELSDEEVTLGVGRRLPPGVPDGVRLLDVLFELTVDGVGNLLHVQRPEPVARGMAEFLRRYSMAATDPERLSVRHAGVVRLRLLADAGPRYAEAARRRPGSAPRGERDWTAGRCSLARRHLYRRHKQASHKSDQFDEQSCRFGA